ncbi:MAG: hypothetical protein JW782_06900 [Candidatus Saganbacteria bacterium]|nr:hypothetical protein [Candidatus Saganbacteria bacterium]
MTRINGLGPNGKPARLQPNFRLHGSMSQLSGARQRYVRPFLPQEMTQEQRGEYARSVTERFAQLVRQNREYIGTNRGTQIDLFKQVLNSGNIRLLEHEGRLVGLIMFKVYERGREAEMGVVKLVKAVVDRDLVTEPEFTAFIETFCSEARDELGARMVVSQEKNGETMLTRAMKSAGFRELDLTKETIEFRIFRNLDRFSLYQRDLA